MAEIFSAEQKRACLGVLNATRLREIIAALGIVGTPRRLKSDLIEAVAVREIPFEELLGLLKLAELKSFCEILALENTGRTKSELVERITSAGRATERSSSSAPPPMSVRTAGALKSALRRFVLDAAGGYRGRDGAGRFTTRLFEAFNWPGGRPPGATIPAVLSVAEHGERTTRGVAALWNERRALVEVTEHDVMLDFAWRDLLRACLQIDPVPQYIVLTNQRDLHLYDLARDRETPRLSIAVDDLPKYSEAFPFLSASWVPGATPKIINVSKVSREVADLVARLHRSLTQQHPKRQDDVIKFTLQCIIAMFAEDIGLLPPDYFTTLLYEGAKKRNVESRLEQLFVLMSTRKLPPGRAVPFFNGGLFTDPISLPLGDAQLTALTKAAEANWKYVDPHIFGSVFQGIMNDAERHASGGHYTAHDDIMRVVGPTIVEPWRKRIRDARTLADLQKVRKELFAFRVLDPACGSGNFLYVAFRELYRLDTELLARIRREFASTHGEAWSTGIPATNFYGIDINPFAVELAKVTLNIAKKIAFEERKETAAEASAQMEIDVDPSLPLDNLGRNIVRDDALFAEWPQVDAIVGNPPFVAGTSISTELGAAYLEKIRAAFPGVPGRADYCSYWFRRAHDHLPRGGRAGLIGTSSVREGNTREASLDYVVAHGGTITNAVSSRPWSGEATVNVAMVNWVKGPSDGPHLLVIDGHVYERAQIASHLQLHSDLGAARELRANEGARSSQGVHIGTKACQTDAATASGLFKDPAARRYVKPVAHGKHLLAGKLSTAPDFIVDMSDCSTHSQARTGGAAFDFLQKRKLPEVKSKSASFEGWLERWWQAWRPRESFFLAATDMKRIIVCSKHAARPIFVFLSRAFLPTDSLQLFAFDDDYSFGVLQSSAHWRWAVGKGSKIKEDTRYTMEVWSTFPWPQDPPEALVANVARAARELRAVRAELMDANGWSLRALHQAAEVAGSHPLKDAQHVLDDAVAQAYGMPADQDATAFLLELNRCLVEDEQHGRAAQGPGLPAGLDPMDPRWSSDDCIEPPPLEE